MTKHPADRIFKHVLGLYGHRPWQQYALGHAGTRLQIVERRCANVSVFRVNSKLLGRTVFYTPNQGGKPGPGVLYRINIKWKGNPNEQLQVPN